MSAPYKDYSNNNLTPTITGRVQAHPNSPSTLINNSLPLRISNNGTILVKSQYDEASGI
jgi:hypothetical protein